MPRTRGRGAASGSGPGAAGDSALVDLLSASVRARSRLLTFAPGDVIVREGEEGCSAFILLSGRCEVMVHREVLNQIHAGELFGEIACLEDGTRTATVRATMPSHVLELSGGALRSELRRSPALLDRFLRAVTHRVRDISRRETTMRDEQRQLRAVLEDLQPALARFEKHSAFSVDVRWEPLSVTSGDYYDVLELSPDRTLFALGDVMGHGAPTAPIVATVRGQLHEVATADSRPHDLLMHLHQHLRRHGPPNVFMTMTLLILDSTTSIAQFAVGGPPCPLICRDGGCRPVTGQFGWTLGYPFDPISFETETLPLSAGDVLVFHTDGVLDAACGPDQDRDMLGTDRLREIVADVCQAHTIGTAGAIHSAVARYQAGWPVEDDATVMVVRVR